MTIKEYEDFMSTSKVYECLPIIYPILGMNGEAGEAAEKVKKILRDANGKFTDDDKQNILKELADTLWYIWAAADDMGYTLEDVMKIGVKKVKERQLTNTVHGNGDDREKLLNIRTKIYNSINSKLHDFVDTLHEIKSYEFFYKLEKNEIIININANDYEIVYNKLIEFCHYLEYFKGITKQKISDTMISFKIFIKPD